MDSDKPICIFIASEGITVVATASGTVMAVNEDAEYGHNVWIDHGNGYKTVYAHCSSLNVSTGDSVQKGQFISRIGMTGKATGNHLHFEVQYYGERVNPLDYVFPNFS